MWYFSFLSLFSVKISNPNLKTIRVTIKLIQSLANKILFCSITENFLRETGVNCTALEKYWLLLQAERNLPSCKW